MSKPLATDFKKWLSYSFDNQGFENHYNLFKALQSSSTFASVKISKSLSDERDGYTVSVDGVDEELEITDRQRADFLKYLTDTYFRTAEVEGIMLEKVRQADVAKNHNFAESKNHSFVDEESEFKVRPHPKETTYYNVKLTISVLIYIMIAAYIAYAAMSDLSMIVGIVVIVLIMLVGLLMNKIVHGIFVGLIRGNSVRVTQEQFPEIYEVIKDQARKLKVAIPEIYITSGDFNAFVTKFSRSHILMLYSQVVETAMKGNYDVLRYVTAHELCHIKQKHLSKRAYLFPSRIIPFLSLAYSRGCEYTCDRVGYHFSPKGSVEGVLIMTTGKEIYAKFNVEQHIRTSQDNEGFWTWFSEKFLTHPHLYKRLIEIKNFSKYS